ncbi:DUF4124 domain-containing protein [Nitrospira sp. NS4]|uniref:DUF4124 domain-containing protein n=1 Tax=Nitrospira sp. NS4 TaxID=3414498 RepID=UPI003C2ACDED
MGPRVLRDLPTGVPAGWTVLMICWLLGLATLPAHAVTIYSYIDEQGNPRYTDSPDTIPERYRARVQMHEQANPRVTPPSKFESVKRAVVEKSQGVGVIQFSGLSPGQSQILTYAGGAAIALLIIMYLTKSPMMRLLALGLLIVLGIGTPLFMYVSGDGPADIMKRKALAASEAQQDRLKPAGQ